ncbi:hypothetical protein FOA52_009429 [Chlamydomonas sp. UWO 241]|nr:hypothetical protein FOA52_009429 [Chlamydomonas sp. UWO 241]
MQLHATSHGSKRLGTAVARSATVGRPYRGRLAPSPTGLLHLGHAKHTPTHTRMRCHCQTCRQTFWWAYQRALDAGGSLVMRNDDLDTGRVRPEFFKAQQEDLSWFGITWQAGPDMGGPHGPYSQSERMGLYQAAFEQLRDKGVLFPCTCSRKDIMSALSAPHQGTEEPVYPGTCRGNNWDVDGGVIAPEPSVSTPSGSDVSCAPEHKAGGQRPQSQHKLPVTWRFRVPDGEEVSFVDGHFGRQVLVAGKDLGDFLVWRSDGVPTYQLACMVDDAQMGITEVVRGADLMTSTARQLLLFRALDLPEPNYFHTPLVLSENGVRLAKRHDALSIRSMREAGATPEGLREGWSGGEGRAIGGIPRQYHWLDSVKGGLTTRQSYPSHASARTPPARPLSGAPEVTPPAHYNI